MYYQMDVLLIRLIIDWKMLTAIEITIDCAKKSTLKKYDDHNGMTSDEVSWEIIYFNHVSRGIMQSRVTGNNFYISRVTRHKKMSIMGHVTPRTELYFSIFMVWSEFPFVVHSYQNLI